MKQFFILSIGLFIGALSSCETKNQHLADLVKNPVSASGGSDSKSNAAKIKFENDVFDFGTITQGEIVNHTYVFKNTGESDLVITSTETSCGCTVPEYPKQAIKVGEKGEIKVKFDSAGKNGATEKTVSIIANTIPTKTVLKIKGTIVAN